MFLLCVLNTRILMCCAFLANWPPSFDTSLHVIAWCFLDFTTCKSSMSCELELVFKIVKSSMPTLLYFAWGDHNYDILHFYFVSHSCSMCARTYLELGNALAIEAMQLVVIKIQVALWKPHNCGSTYRSPFDLVNM
jgi:hypothetical protein